MKIQWKTLILCIAIPLAVGGLSALFTADSMQSFQVQPSPPLSPPGWLFPIVWTILYTLMGIASYFIVQSDQPKQEALFIYGLQLFVNFFWSILFFRFEFYFLAFLWLILLWILIFKTMTEFGKISLTAKRLLIPYLLWVTFAGYLNLYIALT